MLYIYRHTVLCVSVIIIILYANMHNVVEFSYIMRKSLKVIVNFSDFQIRFQSLAVVAAGKPRIEPLGGREREERRGEGRGGARERERDREEKGGKRKIG